MRYKFLSLLVSSTFLYGCAGYSVYKTTDTYSDYKDESGLYFDTKGKLNTCNHYCSPITKEEVKAAWGDPIEIRQIEANNKSYIKKYNSKYYDQWVYDGGQSFSGFMPILIIPIPLFWWPDGSTEIKVNFTGNTVSRVYLERREFDLQKLCYLVPPQCITSFTFFSMGL